MLKLVLLSVCVVGALSSLIRPDRAWPNICPIDLEYDAELKKCVEPGTFEESTARSPDFSYLYEELTEKTTEPQSVSTFTPDDYY